jgi:hypothetical protein
MHHPDHFVAAPLRSRFSCLALSLAFAALLPAAEEYSYWIEACPPETARVTSCQTGDAELGRWALEAWQREAGGAIVFRKSATEEHARFRMHWVNGSSGLYGETEPMLVDGRRGANIYVLPSVAPGTDPLLRDAIVYLTCLHESGHALGLVHTSAFPDIMYSFQYGGDIPAYFNRYRVLLKTRADIAAHSGISDADRIALRGALRQ